VAWWLGNVCHDSRPGLNAKIKQGDTILVHGANGGVGAILTQLAQIAKAMEFAESGTV
jgi:NADPH:quinone reductase-like Zn-dependent oxidoreductase